LLGLIRVHSGELGDMDLIIYPMLGYDSKKAWLKTKKKWGHPKRYTPRPDLVFRLMKQLNWSREQVLDRIEKERAWVLKYSQYFI